LTNFVERRDAIVRNRPGESFNGEKRCKDQRHDSGFANPGQGKIPPEQADDRPDERTADHEADGTADHRAPTGDNAHIKAVHPVHVEAENWLRHYDLDL
jgi:hypothetical protein